MIENRSIIDSFREPNELLMEVALYTVADHQAIPNIGSGQPSVVSLRP